MSSTDLVFRLLALNEASKVFKEVRNSAAETAAAVKASNMEMAESSEAAAAKQAAAAEEGAGKGLLGVSPVLLGVAAAVAAVGAKSVEMASEFTKGVTTLQTGAGESAANMKMVTSGILDMAPAVGQSTQQLTSGLYMIESAGFHGAEGLQVLKAAAEGAKVGNADLSTVGNALTDVLNDYHLPADKAVAVTNQLVTTVASGKTTMEELSGSLSNVVPLASSAGLSFDQVGGALATMTGHGMSAQQASQDLANTIRSLQAPNAVAVHEMQQLGLNSNQVSQELGQKGLTGTLAELTQAITSHMGPAGTVIQSAFNNSAAAAQNAKTMMSQMPAELQKLAKGLMDGSITSKQWATDLKGLSPVQAGLMTQFEATAKQTHEFNHLLTSGGPAAQTYNAALEKMTGGATGLTTSLMLTGENADTFASNVKAIGQAGQSAGKDVTGWAEVTQTLSFKLDQAKQVVETLGIRIGLALTPAVSALLTGFTDTARVVGDVTSWFMHHKEVAEALGIGIAAVLLPSLWGMVTALGAAAIEAAIAAAPFIAAAAVVALLAYGFMQLVDHWHTVEHVLGEGFHWFTDHWKELVSIFLPGIGLLIVAITEIVEHWKQIQHDLGEIWQDVVRFFERYFVEPNEQLVRAVVRIFDDTMHGLKVLFTEDIPSWWHAATDFFNRYFVEPNLAAVHAIENGFVNSFRAVRDFVSTVFDDLVSIVREPLDGVIGLVDDAIGYLNGLHVDIPSWVPVVGGESWGVSLPRIPMLASGGLVMPQPGGATVTVAEAGQPEIVTPLPAMQQAMTAALMAALPSTGAGGDTGQPLSAQLELRLDGQTIDRVLVKFLRQGGRLQFLQIAH